MVKIFEQVVHLLTIIKDILYLWYNLSYNLFLYSTMLLLPTPFYCAVKYITYGVDAKSFPRAIQEISNKLSVCQN